MTIKTITANDDFNADLYAPATTGETGAVDININFRATAGYVTDGANSTYCIGDDAYPTTRGGYTFGWESVYYTANGDRDRSNTVDVRLAGIVFVDVVASLESERTFRLDLGSGGTYNVEVDGGDPTSAVYVAYTIKDNTTLRTTFTKTQTSGANRWFDINAAEWTEVTWPGSHGNASINISSGILRVTLTPDIDFQGVVISHLRVFN